MNYNKADFIASYGISSQLPESDRPELSFSGRSNVGKSSLINKLCNIPCWCSSSTAAMPPARMTCRC